MDIIWKWYVVSTCPGDFPCNVPPLSVLQSMHSSDVPLHTPEQTSPMVIPPYPVVGTSNSLVTAFQTCVIVVEKFGPETFQYH